MTRRTHGLQPASVVVSVLLCVLSMTVLARPLPAQAVAVAQVSGVVADPSGAAIAGAQVRITETDKHMVRTATTDEGGRYALPNLPVGPYQLGVTAAGFKNYLQSGIVLQVGNSVQINVVMELGLVTDSVRVTSDAGMVETRDSSVSQVIDQHRIIDLPLNGRQATQLILLAGGASAGPSSNFVNTKTSSSAVAISIAGGQGNGVNYLLDGGDNNHSFYNVNLPFPFPDALQEFSVQTGSVPARYGLHPAGVVNAVTKSGTNEWHGNLFEFLRNGNVNARNFFAPRHDSLKRNQFGGTVGSKIIRDKLFFFGAFQGTFNRSDPQAVANYVPTPAVLAGDFSTIVGGGCVSGGVGRTLIDPTTSLPFPNNNQIPVSRFNQQSLNLLKYVPSAQTACGKVTYGIPVTGDDEQVVGRVDWVHSPKHTFYVRYFLDDWRNPPVYDGKNLLTTTAPGTLERSQSLTLGDTYSFNSTTVNGFHATATRYRNNRVEASNIPNLSSLGVNVPTPVPNHIQVAINGYFSVGCGSCATAHNNTNSFHFADDLDIIRGKHQIAFGVDYIRNQYNNLNTGTSDGAFTFNGDWASGKRINDALAAFMLGVPNDFTQAVVQQNATRFTVFALYVQDSIRLTPRLTMNAGLRWDPMLIPYDYFDNGNIFSLSAFIAGQRSKVFTNAPAGLLFYGDPGMPRGFEHRRLANFSPRLGIVWDPTGTGRQTIRLSGAILRDTENMAYNSRLTVNAPYSTSIAVQFPVGGFTNPWLGYPGGVPFPLPSPLPSNFNFPSAGVYASLPMDPRSTYMAQWNLSYQRQITPNWLASVSYIGNKTTHLWVGEDINPGVYIPGSNANINLRRRLYLQNPALGAAYAAIVQSDQNANSNYNGLLLSLQHRFSHGVTVLTNYTWSHCISDADYSVSVSSSQYMNPYNRSLDRGNCSFDLRHQTNTSLIVVSPVNGNGFARRILKEWQIAPIVSIRGGLPLNITDGTDISQTGIGLDRPNLILPNAYSSGSNPLYVINRAAFQNQAAGTFGTLGRNALVGPGAVNVDFSLSRTFHFRERWGLEARAEAFNVINHPNFVGTNPTVRPAQTGLSTSLNSSTFGVIQSANDPRILQFAMKLHF